VGCERFFLYQVAMFRLEFASLWAVMIVGLDLAKMLELAFDLFVALRKSLS
jgi:hypothetical protein